MVIQAYGPIGYERAKRLLEENREFVEKHFPGFFIRQFEAIGKEKIRPVEGAVRIIGLGEHGLFGALWELGETFGSGLEVDLRAIPLRQEVVEILELFNESPYECPSKGSMILANYKEIPGCTTIGRITEEKARVVKDVDGIRYLTPPDRQEKDILNRVHDTKETGKIVCE